MHLDVRSDEFWAITHASGNYSTNGFPTRIPTVTAPSGDGVIMFGAPTGEYAAEKLLLYPFGVGTPGQTFLIQVIGWRRTTGRLGQTAIGTVGLFVPFVLGAWTATLGTTTGVASADIGSSQNFCNAIITLNSLGFRQLEVNYSTGGSATSCNGLYVKA